MARVKPTAVAAVPPDDETSSSYEEEEEQQQQQQQKRKPPTLAEKSSNHRSKSLPTPSDEDEGGEEEKQNQLQMSHKHARKPQKSSHDVDKETDNEAEEEKQKKKKPPPPPSQKAGKKSQQKKPKKSAAVSPASPPQTSSTKKPRLEAADLETVGDGKKRKLFERIWSGDAEEKILNGIIEFHKRRGTKTSTLNSDIDALHEFMKKYLSSVEFTKSQLSNKFHTLRKKFRSNSAKNVGSPNFARDVDRTVYELSKKIWGSQENGNDEGDGAAIESDKGSEDETDQPMKTSQGQTPETHITTNVVVNKEVELAFPFYFEALARSGKLKLTDEAAKRILTKVDNGKAVALEEKLRKHKKVEMKTHLRWLELMKEVTKLAVEGVDK